MKTKDRKLIRLIKEEFSSVYNVAFSEIEGRSRRRPVVEARHSGMLAAREALGLTLKETAAAFNCSNYNSVRHAEAKLAKLRKKDKDFDQMLRHRFERWRRLAGAEQPKEEETRCRNRRPAPRNPSS